MRKMYIIVNGFGETKAYCVNSLVNVDVLCKIIDGDCELSVTVARFLNTVLVVCENIEVYHNDTEDDVFNNLTSHNIQII